MRSNNLNIRIAGSSCRPQLQTRDCSTMEALISGHPWDAEKVPVSWRPLTGAYGNVKIQSLYGSSEKRGFVKAAVIRVVRLRECPLEVLPLLT